MTSAFPGDRPAERSGDRPAAQPAAGLPEPSGEPIPDAIVVIPAEPATDPVVLVPAEPADMWSGTVVDAVPTTADDIAARVLAVPGVVRLHAGRFGEVATYLPGRRVTGIKIGDDGVEVHVVIAADTPIRPTAQLIHAAVATLVADPVHVYVEDVAA